MVKIYSQKMKTKLNNTSKREQLCKWERSRMCFFSEMYARSVECVFVAIKGKSNLPFA